MDIASAAAIVKSAKSVGPKDKECVKVVVRCRPLFGKEITENRKSIVTLNTETSVISVKNPANDQIKTFAFDSIYDENTEQSFFYEESGFPLVESIFEGYNGTIFAYGQTGCGKTHTMQGSKDAPGVIPHAFDHIFESISANGGKLDFMVLASYLEIYNENIRDLLGDDSKKKLDLKESADTGPYVQGLTEVAVASVKEIQKIMDKGFNNRTVGATAMNLGSSRSHAIFSITIETCEKAEEGKEKIKRGKLHLVDLAGSERQSKTGASGQRLKEGCKINQSLSALGNVISALVDGGGKHIPYRDSKLTRLLKDSLGGNAKTVMVAAVSPADYNYDETLSTLRYANRAKNIKNKPVVNEDPKDAKLREYLDEIVKLRQQLQAVNTTAPSSSEVVVVKEVVPESHIQEKEALEQYNKTILDEKNAMGKELEQTTMEIDKYKKEKELLESRLSELQSGIIPVATTDIKSEDKAREKEQAEFRKAQVKLKAKKKKEAQLQAAKTALEFEKQAIEEELKNAQEEAHASLKASKKKSSKYKGKLEAAREEIHDLVREFQREREILLETIRDQGQQFKLLEQLAECFLTPNELSKVWENAEWLEEEEKWKLPKIKPKSGFEKLPDLGTPLTPPSSSASVGDLPASMRSKSNRKKKKKKKESDDDNSISVSTTTEKQDLSMLDTSEKKRKKKEIKNEMLPSI